MGGGSILNLSRGGRLRLSRRLRRSSGCLRGCVAACRVLSSVQTDEEEHAAKCERETYAARHFPSLAGDGGKN